MVHHAFSVPPKLDQQLRTTYGDSMDLNKSRFLHSNLVKNDIFNSFTTQFPHFFVVVCQYN